MIFFFKCIRISRGTRSDWLFYEKITATPFNGAISVQYFQLDFQPLHPETKHRLIKIGSCNLSDIMIVKEVSNQFNRFQKPGLESYFLTLSRSFRTLQFSTLVEVRVVIFSPLVGIQSHFVENRSKDFGETLHECSAQ